MWVSYLFAASKPITSNDGRLCRQFDVGGVCLWFRHRLPFFTQAIEVERDCVPHVIFHFLAWPASRNTSWQIWGVGRKPVCVGSMTIKYFFITSILLVSRYCSMFREPGSQAMLLQNSRQLLRESCGGRRNFAIMRMIHTTTKARKPARMYHMRETSGRFSGCRLDWIA